MIFKKYPTRGFVFGQLGGLHNFSDHESFYEKVREMFRDMGAHQNPAFTATVSRMRHTFKPSTLRLNKIKEDKKQNYLDQTRFIMRYIIGQKIYEEQKKQIDEI